MRSIIVGTAGHIDHGKTTLVRALTGVDADRLPEEKRRGITIDLGFAELDLGDVRVGFVDVPGHERFIKNMLAGAHGIDAVMLVVAADEGVMPQTREHFDITRLLETKSGLVVVTKSDAVDEELLELVRAEVEELTENSFLENAPVVPVSAKTGAGLDELKNILRDIARQTPARSTKTVARLPIDRAFTMRGFGAVVTGTLVAGEIREGDEVEILPVGLRARVRGVQVHNRNVEKAEAGQRTAINLSGVEAAQLERGMTLAPVGRLQPTQSIDAQAEVLPHAARGLRSRQRVRVAIGAAEVLARVVALEETGEIAAGASGFAQLRFEAPIAAVLDERFIIRTYSPPHTIAGGRVLDAAATKHRGREARREARARLAALMNAGDAARVKIYVEAADERGLRRSEIAARTGWRDEILDAALRDSLARKELIEAEGVLIGRESFTNLTRAMIEAVENYHRREPLARGLLRETLREQVFARVPPEIFRAALADAEARGKIVAERDVVRSASHKVALSVSDEELKKQLEEIYRAAALEILTFDEALTRAALATPPARAHGRKLLQMLLDERTLVRVSGEMLAARAAIDDLIKMLRDYAAQNGARAIDVPKFKELTGVSRKYAIPLLEYLDRERVTRRAGDQRQIL
jgi:selenocysteine-specific elongation factor